MIEGNRAAARLLGIDRAAIAGVPLSAFLPADGERFERHLREVLDAGVGGCVLGLRAGGRELSVRCESNAHYGASGTGIRCVLFELPAGRAVEASGGAVREALVGLDAAGRICSASPGVRGLLGFEPAVLVGAPLSSVVPGLSGDPELAQGERLDVLGRCSDGTLLPLELSISAWNHGDAVLFAVLRDARGGSRDLTWLRQMGEHLGAVLYLWERGVLSFIGDACSGIWGRTASDLVAAPSLWLEAVHPEDRERLERARDGLGGGREMDVEYRVRRPDGTERSVRDRAFVLRGEPAVPVRVIGTLQDVTAVRERERHQIQSQKMETLGALAGGVAHDFANLLMGIGGCARIAERGATSQERELFGRIASAAERGTSLARQLLVFTCKRKIDEVPVAVDDALHRIAPLVARLVGSHIRIVLSTGAPTGIVLADPVQIDQVVMNLAANARDAMPEGGLLRISTDEVEIGAADAGALGCLPGRFVRLAVEDDGCGMDEATRERVFEPYFTTKAPGTGTGMGLSTVYAIAKGLGGAVRLDSAPGVGTRVALLLPGKELPAAAPSRVVEPLPAHTALVVEDDPLVRKVIVDHLIRLGSRVVESAGPEEAATAAWDAPVDVLVADVVLDGTTGPLLAERLRRRHPGLQALFVSAHPHAQLVDLGTLDPGLPFLQKPFELADLRRQLAPLLTTGS